MKEVFKGRHPTEAHFVKGLLESDGIEAEIRNEALFVIRGEVPMSPDALPSVWVGDEDEAAARELLRDYYSDRPIPTDGRGAWVCPKCGEKHEAQFTTCWRCRTDRPEGSPSV